MNTIDTLIERIEEYRTTNKVPCKNYATKEAAEKATSKMAKIAGNHFDSTRKEAEYVVVFNEAWGRWIGAVNMNELATRKESVGGYIGICSQFGFYSY
jgi:hypothetical protein